MAVLREFLIFRPEKCRHPRSRVPSEGLSMARVKPGETVLVRSRLEKQSLDKICDYRASPCCILLQHFSSKIP